MVVEKSEQGNWRKNVSRTERSWDKSDTYTESGCLEECSAWECVGPSTMLDEVCCLETLGNVSVNICGDSAVGELRDANVGSFVRGVRRPNTGVGIVFFLKLRFIKLEPEGRIGCGCDLCWMIGTTFFGRVGAKAPWPSRCLVEIPPLLEGISDAGSVAIFAWGLVTRLICLGGCASVGVTFRWILACNITSGDDSGGDVERGVDGSFCRARLILQILVKAKSTYNNVTCFKGRFNFLNFFLSKISVLWYKFTVWGERNQRRINTETYTSTLLIRRNNHFMLHNFLLEIPGRLLERNIVIIRWGINWGSLFRLNAFTTISGRWLWLFTRRESFSFFWLMRCEQWCIGNVWMPLTPWISSPISSSLSSFLILVSLSFPLPFPFRLSFDFFSSDSFSRRKRFLSFSENNVKYDHIKGMDRRALTNPWFACFESMPYWIFFMIKSNVFPETREQLFTSSLEIACWFPTSWTSQTNFRSMKKGRVEENLFASSSYPSHWITVA